jgi:hypothetical protein
MVFRMALGHHSPLRAEWREVKEDFGTICCPEGLCPRSRRDDPIVAWHEVPGTAPPQKSRPVGYGLIRAGMRTESMIGVISSP